ncbi:MAG TPA: alpha/beta hydrolase [Terricaulis sp.]|nr:alpha/beta hydrolase [Terricaulis sp.]
MMFWLVGAALIAATFGLLLAALAALFFGAMAAASLLLALLAASFLICLALWLGARAYVKRVEARWPAQGRMIEADGARIHVRETGPAGAPRVLLLHGANANLNELWGPFAAELSRDFRIIAMDRPGLGYSTRPRRGHQLAAQARLAAEVLKQTGEGPAIIVGHSLGAAVALRVALDAPALVRGLVLLAPLATPWQGYPVWWARLAATPVLSHIFCGLIIPNLGPALARANIDNNFLPGAAPENYYDKSAVGLAFRPLAFRSSAQDVCSASAELAVQAPRYPEIFAPAIVITAEKDRVISPKRHARALAAALPAAELVIAPDCGHMPHQLRPDLGITAIRRVNAMASVSAAS